MRDEHAPDQGDPVAQGDHLGQEVAPTSRLERLGVKLIDPDEDLIGELEIACDEPIHQDRREVRRIDVTEARVGRDPAVDLDQELDRFAVRGQDYVLADREVQDHRLVAARGWAQDEESGEKGVAMNREAGR